MLRGRCHARTDEVSVLEVEAVELVAGRFCVHYVFINDKGGALAVVGDTLADLAAERSVIRANRRRPHARAHGDEEADDVPHRAELAKEIEEFLWGDVEAATGLAHRAAATGHGATDLRFLTKRALCKRRVSANVEGVGGSGLGLRTRCGQGTTYRLTSGANFPPRLILWRRWRVSNGLAAGWEMDGRAVGGVGSGDRGWW